MTTYSRREIVTKRVEYGIESGSVVGDFYKVAGIAWADYCSRTGQDSERVPDDWARIEARDDEIVIRFDVETATREAGS